MSTSESSGSSEDEEEPPQKNLSLRDFRTKAEKSAQYVFPLDKKGQNERRATVSEFRGKVRIDIREYYLDGDEWKPGRKGISLDVDQWRALMKVIPLIQEATEAFGGK